LKKLKVQSRCEKTRQPVETECNEVSGQTEHEGSAQNIPLLGRSIRPVLCINPFPYDSGNEYDDQLKEENVHGGLILQGFVHLGALPSSNPQFEGGMHQDLRGIRAIDADCNRRLHLKGWRVSG
jgi:hypothetical protein